MILKNQLDENSFSEQSVSRVRGYWGFALFLAKFKNGEMKLQNVGNDAFLRASICLENKSKICNIF